jgi:thioredoxin reductase (NADPH)
MRDKTYDLIIIGAGPAALTSAIYSTRYKMSTLVIGKTLGGELSLAHNVCNFPGYQSIPGIELAQKMKVHAESQGAKVLLKEVGKITLTNNKQQTTNNDKFEIQISENEKYRSKALIVATGSERRRLNIPGEKEHIGRGVSYCYTCDGYFFKNKTVAVIGGSNAAIVAALYLADVASKVYIIYRKEQLRAEPMWIDDWKKVEESGKGITIYKTNVAEIIGNGQQISEIKLDNPYQQKDSLQIDGLFIEIGSIPGTALIEPLGLEIDDTGHVIVNDNMETKIPGLFCAGDMTSKSKDFKQATLACAQGALASASAFKYLKKEKAPQIKGI